MKLLIEKAITLYEYRRVQSNLNKGITDQKGKLTASAIGRILYPGASDQNVYNSIGNLKKGRVKGVKLEWIKIICSICDVDPNFLLGFPSKYDKEFSQINK